MGLSNIKEKMNDKGLDSETQNYIIEYLSVNQELFGDFLDIDKMADRIVNNINGSKTNSLILNNNPFTILRALFMTLGVWNAETHKLHINHILEGMSKVFKRENDKKISVMMHELDHCATTTYVDKNSMENNKENPIRNYLSVSGKKDKKEIDKMIEKNKEDYNLYIIGIQGELVSNNELINLKNLNEGITVYKQNMYDDYKGRKRAFAYVNQKITAEAIGNIIGKEKLIYYHYNNDYEGIRREFNKKTGGELNDLVNKLNESCKFDLLFLGYKIKQKDLIETIDQYHIKDEFDKNEHVENKGNNFKEELSIDSHQLNKQIIYTRESQKDIILEEKDKTE